MFNNVEKISKINEELIDLRKELSELKKFDFHDVERMNHLMSLYYDVKAENNRLFKQVNDLKIRLNQNYGKNNLNKKSSLVSGLGGVEVYVLVTKIGINKFVKLQWKCGVNISPSKFYQLKNIKECSMFSTKEQAEKNNPDPELFKVVKKFL